MSTSTSSRATNGAGSPQSFAGLPEGVAQYVQDFVGKPGRLLIHGEWVEAASGKTFETLNPATEESLGWGGARRGRGHRPRCRCGSSVL
jgi:hypothetical protein